MPSRIDRTFDYERRALTIDAHMAEFYGLHQETVSGLRRNRPSEHRRMLAEWQIAMDSWYPATVVDGFPVGDTPFWQAWNLEQERAKMASREVMQRTNRCPAWPMKVPGLVRELVIAGGLLFCFFVLTWLFGFWGRVIGLVP